MARTEVAELGRKLLEALRGRRDAGGPYPLTVAQLAAAADPQATADQIDKALGAKPAASQLVRARKKDPASPIALAEDAERLSASAPLLEYALARVCSTEKPLHPPARLATQVDPALRPGFVAALERRLAEGSLPEAVGVRQVKGKPQLYLRSVPPPPPPKHPAEELGERLLQVLQARRDRGADYPAALDRVAAEVAPGAKPALLKQAVAREPFRTEAVVAVPARADSPVALAGDRDRLAASAELVEYLLAAASTPRRPVAPLSRLEELLAEGLRPAFAEALRRRREARDLPAGIEFFDGPRGPELLLLSRLTPAAALAWRMLRALEVCREEDFPTTLDALVRSAQPGEQLPPEVVAAALKDKALKPHLLLAVTGDPRTPVALAEDAGRLADWPGLPAAVLATVRTMENQALAVGDLKKKLARPLQSAFAEALDRRLRAHELPAGVGLLRVKRSPLLFLLADVNTSWPAARTGLAPLPGEPGTGAEFSFSPRPGTPGRGAGGEGSSLPQESGPLTPSPSPPEYRGRGEQERLRSPEYGGPGLVERAAYASEDFEHRFDAAFDRLDRERDGNNLVSLVALRAALADDRLAFDAGLKQLRRQGRYSLSAAEGRHGILPEEHDAGVVEDGSLLLFVSRKAPPAMSEAGPRIN